MAALAVAGALAAASGCREPIVTAPSLLLITSEGLRADALGCYGPASGPGAAICSIAEHGALFVWAFSTHPETAPAAATLLTSLPAVDHGVTANAASFLRSDTPTVARALRAAGLATAAFVSSPSLNESRNLGLGFDDYRMAPGTTASASARATTEAFAAWLAARRPAEQAFFAWLHYPAVDERLGPHAGLSLEALDEEVASALAAARSRTVAGELGIAFAALAGGPGEEAAPLALERVRIPLLWAPPGGVSPQRLGAPVALLDVAPSLMQQAGLLVPARLAGEPLRVGPLPPAQARPSRPLRLEAENEVGVVLSRRYYARPRDGAFARTALLADSGTPSARGRIDVRARDARDYELELGLPATGETEPTFHDDGTDVPPAGSPGAEPVAKTSASP